MLVGGWVVSVSHTKGTGMSPSRAFVSRNIARDCAWPRFAAYRSAWCSRARQYTPQGARVSRTARPPVATSAIVRSPQWTSQRAGSSSGAVPRRAVHRCC